METINKKEWLEERRKGLGGSDSPVVLGVSPFKTRLELWQEKRGLVKKELEPTPAMKRGIVLEPIVADLYARETSRKLLERKEILYHKEHPFMLANIDREIANNDSKGQGVLEIKCPGLKVFSQCKREGLPDYYQVQLQHYLEVTGRQWGSFAVFNAERWELIWFDVKRNAEIIDYIVMADSQFWDLVQQGEPPEEDQEKPNFPTAKPSEILKINDVKWEYAVRQLHEAQELRKEAEAIEAEAIKNTQDIMEFHKAQIVEGAGARIYWTYQDGRVSIDSKRLKKELPEIWKKYQKKSKPFRRFRAYFLKKTINE